MAVNLSPIEMARQLSARNQNNGNNTTYFSLKDGETKGIRFLTAMAPMTVVSHSCGIEHVDIKTEEFENAKLSGTQVACPQCGQALSEGDIEFERPAVEGALMHRFIPTSDPNRKANFVCMSNPSNIELGISEGKHQCPICTSPENMNKAGQPKNPSMRVYGIAVERELKFEEQVISGIRRSVMTGAVDVMVTEEDGTVHPKIVIVDMGYQSFWSKLYDFSPDFSNSICYYDWEISRSGSGFDTAYSIQCMNRDAPTTLNMDEYKDYMPDVHAMLSRMADPAYYVKNGWNVVGYIPEQEAQPNQGVAMAQNMMNSVGQVNGYQQQPVAYAPQQQPQQPQQAYAQPMAAPQPIAGGANWNEIQNQLG